MALQSPGVDISIIDESFFTPAGEGTTPLIIVATAQNKTNAAGTAIAAGTIKAAVGRAFRVSSQRELVELFGTPFFEKDGTGSPIHGSERNEYGLQAAYSLLGVSNSAYIVRADVDLDELRSQATEPTSDPENGQHWVDINATQWGIQEWNASTQKFENKVPLVITDSATLEFGAPKNSFGSVGTYAVVAINGVFEVFYKTPSGWELVGSNDWISSITPLNGAVAALQISRHTQVPAWKSSDSIPRPSGSVWIKISEPNFGAKWVVRRWASLSREWEVINAPIFDSAEAAIAQLSMQGGFDIPRGTLYVKANAAGNNTAKFELYRRKTEGVSFIVAENFSVAADNYSFAINASGQSSLVEFNNVSIENADDFATVVNSHPNAVFEAIVSGSRVELIHKNGGELTLSGDSVILGQFNNLTASNWELASSAVASSVPLVGPAINGQVWYNREVSTIDIMVNNGTAWKGYRNQFPATRAQGPVVSATEPSGSFVDNDLWISTADLNNFPEIYRRVGNEWILVNNADQVTEDGIVFADARYGISGQTGNTAASIPALLESDFVDVDAPDPLLYPAGMLLWNLRRSSGNVKQFVADYIDPTAQNVRFGNEAMFNYELGRWVTVSANNADGSGSFGRKAQRAYVVSQLKALVDSNDEIRDEERRNFNLIACPGYPELLGNMNNLNIDRGLTAFVVGDVPLRLPSNATELLAWASNERGALSDGDDGLVSASEYSAIFYPGAGFTNDLTGAGIVVPSSHMMLRTIALSDNVSYPWFAPAGIRRGAITNADSVGFIDNTGEFRTVALNEGQRDTLYNARVNPMPFFNGVGLVNYGQKTLARGTSALDRINVARLVIFLRRQLNVLARPYIFEPNDRVTRQEIKQAVESLLLELVSLRAIDDFVVVCDESNNTPARIDRSELYVDIAIVPIKAVEFIYIPLRVKNTGEL